MFGVFAKSLKNSFDLNRKIKSSSLFDLKKFSKFNLLCFPNPNLLPSVENIVEFEKIQLEI